MNVNSELLRIYRLSYSKKLYDTGEFMLIKYVLWVILNIFWFRNVIGSVCVDLETCLSVHLNSSELKQLIDQRCALGNWSSKESHNRRITFSHLPKTGGSSVRTFFDKHMKHRMHRMEHEHFILSGHAEPKNIFVTMLREPVSRALSFYNYVHEHTEQPVNTLKNTMWTETFKMEPEEWAMSPRIQSIMAQDPLGFFLRDVVNITDSISKYEPSMLKALPEVPLRNVIKGTLDAFLQYTDTLPAEFQCKQHLEVGFILLKHYEVVGVLEKTEDFYRVLLRRAHFPRTITLEHTRVHENKSKQVISAQQAEVMRQHLQRPLFCGYVLWRIAELISAADMQCAQ